MLMRMPCAPWMELSSRSGLAMARLAASTANGFGAPRNAQSAQFPRGRGYSGRGAAARAPAEAGGDKDHVRAFECFDNFFCVFERGFAADFGIGARAEALGELRAKL